MIKIKPSLKKDDISVFLFALLCIALLSPAVQRTIGDIGFLLLAGIYLLINVNRLLNAAWSEKAAVLLAVLYIAMLLFYKVIGSSTASVAYHMSIVRFFLAFICFVPLYPRLSRKQLTFILIVILGTMLVTMYQNYLLKIRLGSMYSIQLYNTAGIKTVINTQYTGAILLMSGALFCGFLNLRQIGKRVLLLALSAICLLFNLLVTQRGIILVLSVLMFPLLILFNSKKKSVWRYVIIMLVIIIVLFCVFDYARILSWIGGITGSARIANRLESIISLIRSGGIDGVESGSLVVRLQLMGNSIRTLFSSPGNFLIGVGFRTETNDLVGNHSQILDEFARFGIIGGLLFILTITKMLKAARKMSVTDRRSVLFEQFSVIVLIFILRACVGTILDPSIGAVLFIAVPVLFRLIIDEGVFEYDHRRLRLRIDGVECRI